MDDQVSVFLEKMAVAKRFVTLTQHWHGIKVCWGLLRR